MKWAQMTRKKKGTGSRFEDLVKGLPQTRKNKDVLKVTPEDLNKEKTLQLDGSMSCPNGKTS